MEEDLDVAYQSYLQRQGVRATAVREKRRRLGMEGDIASDEEEAQGDAEYEPGSDAEEAEEVGCCAELKAACAVCVRACLPVASVSRVAKEPCSLALAGSMGESLPAL